MKVRELLVLLNDLPVDALEKDIYIDNDTEQFQKAKIEPVTESCDDTTIIGYVLVEDKQLSFDFGNNGSKH